MPKTAGYYQKLGRGKEVFFIVLEGLLGPRTLTE
jgi:hypothetical protein